MKRLKFGFRNKSAGEQLSIFERTVQNLAALPSEHLAQTQPDTLARIVGELRKSHDHITNLRTQLKEEITRRKQLLRDARDQTILTANMVAVNMNNDPVKMQTTGFALNAPWQKNSLPDAPAQLRGETTDKEGQAKLRWKRPVRNCFFEIQAQSDPFSEHGWKTIKGVCYKQSYLADGLSSGGKYWFRVRACNARGQGPWSEMVTVRVK